MGTMPRGLSGYESFFTIGSAGAVEELALSGWRTTNDALLVKLAKIDDRDGAGLITGRTLYVPRAEMPEPGEDEYYHVDLLGARVEDLEGRELGRVEDIKPWGAYDMVIVKTRSKSWMLPLVAEYVRTIDPGKGLILVELPEGLGP